MTGEELRRIRLRLGLTQAELAKEFGVARNTVSRWEIGTHRVSGTVAFAIKALAAKRGKKVG